MRWKELPAGPLGARASIPGIDAALVWADASGWRDFRRPGEDLPVRIPAILEIAHGRRAEFDALVGSKSVPPAYRADRRFVTASLATDGMRRVISRLGADGPIRRLELQMPYIPLRPRPAGPPSTPSRSAAPPRSSSKVLIGVIDHGCPFAHLGLRQGRGTRILGLWLQDAQPSAAACAVGSLPGGFGYGVQLDRTALDAIMAAHTDTAGTIDEAACYEALYLSDLRHRYSHGAAALTACSGTRPPTVRFARDDMSPTLDDLADAAARSDVIFVQGPRDAQQDSSSGGLGRNLLDALTYILSCAGETTETIVVNCSDGSSRGSHDGHWLVTDALEEALDRASASRQAWMTVPAGNTGNDARHAKLSLSRSGAWAGVDLLVNPESETATQAIVRVPADIDDLEIRVVPPGVRAGAGLATVTEGRACGLYREGSVVCAVVFPRRGPNASVEALVTWAPTAASSEGPGGLGGLWRLEFRSRRGSTASLNVYIPRTQRNAPQLSRGRQARFVDTSSDGDYDPQRWLRALEVDPPSPRSPIRRSGSLTSLATVRTGSRVVVVGGRFLREARVVPYSSLGPNVPVTPSIGSSRVEPDACRPTDISRGQPGIPVCGVLSGQVVTANGTSFAAPQRARELANHARKVQRRR